MRIYPDKILLNGGPALNNGVYYISGNEETLVNKICDILVFYFKTKKYANIVKTNNQKINQDLNIGLNPSLFSEKTISIHKDPKEIDFEYIEKIDLENDIIIISQSVAKTSPKTKKYFESHKTFGSIACYVLGKDDKKKLIDAYLIKKKIKLNSEAYWFFIESSSDEYQLLENDLEKIDIFGSSGLGINEIKKLTAPDKNIGLDSLFFSLLLPKNKILSITKKTILTSSDAYSFLFRVGFFIDLLSKCSSSKEAEEKLPRYLFKDKSKFGLIFSKTTNKKNINMFLLLKKSEFLIRKNSGMFLIISERFLLNLKQQLL